MKLKLYGLVYTTEDPAEMERLITLGAEELRSFKEDSVEPKGEVKDSKEEVTEDKEEVESPKENKNQKKSK